MIVLIFSIVLIGIVGVYLYKIVKTIIQIAEYDERKNGMPLSPLIKD
jgi:hypothetical protein